MLKDFATSGGGTQKDLARVLNITDISLNATLKKDNMRLDTLRRLAAALNVTVSNLLAESPVSTPAPAQSQEHTNGQGLFCPHCGGRITLYVRAEDTPDPSPQPDTAAGNANTQGHGTHPAL